MSLQSQVEKQWYGKPHWLLLLLPLSGLFLALSRLRRRVLQAKAGKAPCPVIVVGNIAVGGTGKTPLIIALANVLMRAGYRPAIVSRGYGVEAKRPVLVSANAKASQFGDEPVLIANSCACPVVICEDRVAAVEAAISAYGCNVVLSDDGLQHYKMARSFEIAVLDGARGMGNGWCLPVGPLRELPKRLNSVNYVVVNGESAPERKYQAPTVNFGLRPVGWVNVKNGLCKPLAPLPWAAETGNSKQRIMAVAGIGHPERFFNSLKSLNVFFKPTVFPDHYAYSDHDFEINNGGPVVMTAKDAVKCRAFAQLNWWYLAVEAELPKDLEAAVLAHCAEWLPPDNALASDPV